VRKFLIYPLVAVALLSVAGCGYRPINRDVEARFGTDRTLSIPIFANRTFKPNIENIAVNELVGEFARRKGLHVLSGDDADYILNGEVLSYDKAAVSYSGLDKVLEYRATITIAAELRLNATKRILWKGKLSRSQDFPAFYDSATQQNSEDAAISEICRRLAQELYIKMTEEF
jgi:hypothetical protein